METVEFKPYPGNGGKRDGAGRKPRVRPGQLERAEVLAKQLQSAVKLGLSPLLAAYPDLIDIAITRAKGDKDGKGGNDKLLMFLIALPLKMANLDEFRGDLLGNDIIKEALAGARTVNIQFKNDVAPVRRDVTIEGEYRTDAGAAVEPG